MKGKVCMLNFGSTTVGIVQLGEPIAMQVLESKRAQGGAAAHSPQAAALQLYAVINAQSNLVKTQVSLCPMMLLSALCHTPGSHQ